MKKQKYENLPKVVAMDFYKQLGLRQEVDLHTACLGYFKTLHEEFSNSEFDRKAFLDALLTWINHYESLIAVASVKLDFRLVEAEEEAKNRLRIEGSNRNGT